MTPTTTDVPLAPIIRKAVNEGKLVELLQRARGDMLKRVRFSADRPAQEAFNAGRYTILMTHAIPTERVSLLKTRRTQELIAILPNHSDPKLQVMEMSDYSSLSDFNKELNARFRVSSESTTNLGKTRLAICYGNHIFVCEGITGTLYVVWTRFVNRANAGTIENTLFTNVPLLVKTNGDGPILALFVLKPKVIDETDLDLIPLSAQSPLLLSDRRYPIFVCETRRARKRPIRVETMAEQEAIQIVTSLVRGHGATRTNAFAQSVDHEEESPLDTEDDATSHFAFHHTMHGVLEDPLRLGELDAPQPGQETPPALPSESDQGGDPFEDSE